MSELIIRMLSEPAVIIAIIGMFGTVIAKVLTARPEWEKYMGVLITAIKFVEISIPDGTPNKGLARADEALRLAIEVLEKRNIKVSVKLANELKLNIPVVHDMLEANGTL